MIQNQVVTEAEDALGRPGRKFPGVFCASGRKTQEPAASRPTGKYIFLNSALFWAIWRAIALNHCPALSYWGHSNQQLQPPLPAKGRGRVLLHLQCVGQGCFPFGSLGAVPLTCSCKWSITYWRTAGQKFKLNHAIWPQLHHSQATQVLFFVFLVSL